MENWTNRTKYYSKAMQKIVEGEKCIKFEQAESPITDT